MASDRITVRLPSELQRALKALVRATGKTESEIIRVAIEDCCRKYQDEPSCYDVARRMGIIGIIEDAPSDLSTNPKHMEGFGRA
jgi:predicted DNA-binding protein